MIFDEETLAILFEETGANFDEWAESSGYDSASWTDQQIYAALPQVILDNLADFGINASWMHNGM